MWCVIEFIDGHVLLCKGLNMGGRIRRGVSGTYRAYSGYIGCLYIIVLLTLHFVCGHCIVLYHVMGAFSRRWWWAGGVPMVYELLYWGGGRTVKCLLSLQQFHCLYHCNYLIIQ